MGDKPIAYLIPMMTGGFAFWLLSGFRGKYSDHLIDEKKNRNFWTGYFLLILFVSLVVVQLIF